MKEFKNNLKFTWNYVKYQKANFIKYVLLNICLVIISVVVPILSANVIIYLTSSLFMQLAMVALVILVVEVSRNIINYFSTKYVQIIYRETFTLIQNDLGKEILTLDNKSLNGHSSGVFIQRITGDTSRIADVFYTITSNLAAILTNIGIFVAIFIINKYAFIYLFISSLIIGYFQYMRSTKRNEKDKIFRKTNEKVSGFIGEIIRGAKDIKMLNAEKSFLNTYDGKLIDLNKERYDMQDVSRKFLFVSGTCNDISDFFLILLLIFLIKSGNLAIASALIIYNYSGRVVNLVRYFADIIDGIKDFNLSASRIFELKYGEEFTKESFGDKHIKHINGDFEFKNVKFNYGGNDVLKDVSFKIKANTTTAFVGKSGAGKTTIFSLLCKMYDNYNGLITIDGNDIKDLDKDSIRGNITVISQSPYIFNLSIRDNLKLVKEDLTDEDMIKACKMACLDDFINNLPEGYDTIIGEGGVNLSGGQKQRLAIARALVQKTEIILFDEATSALDNETQASIQRAIENMNGIYTILIIAHRLSTIINSDNILFLNNGIIETSGKHKELIKKSKDYKKLYETEIESNKK